MVAEDRLVVVEPPPRALPPSCDPWDVLRGAQDATRLRELTEADSEGWRSGRVIVRRSGGHETYRRQLSWAQ